MLLSVLAFLRFLARLALTVWRELRRPDNPEFRHLLSLVVLTLASGTVFYHFVEGWRWLDSLYFSLVTLATVGFGDLSPKTDFGKVFTMIYILVGLGLLAAFVNALGQRLLQSRERLGLRRPRRQNDAPSDETPGEEG
jgi:hypothetical protein